MEFHSGLGMHFPTGDATAGRIAKEIVEILWEELHPLHKSIPTVEPLTYDANKFENVWNFPNVFGCLNCKCICIVCPSDSVTMFFNYRKYFSTFLRGIVDAKTKFITFDMGGFGKQSDGDTFFVSEMFSFIDGKRIIFPEPDFLLHRNVKAPYVMLGDEASLEQEKPSNALLKFCFLNGVLFRKQ